MSHIKSIKLVLFVSVVSAVLFQFQNCAPSNLSSLADASHAINSGTISMIDNLHKGTQVTFVQNEVLIPANQQDLQVDGICDGEQSGAILAWKISDIDNQTIATGNARCELSGFRVYLSAINQLPCGKPFELKAQFGFDKGDQLILTRECQN